MEKKQNFSFIIGGIAAYFLMKYLHKKKDKAASLDITNTTPVKDMLQPVKDMLPPEYFTKIYFPLFSSDAERSLFLTALHAKYGYNNVSNAKYAMNDVISTNLGVYQLGADATWVKTAKLGGIKTSVQQIKI